MSIKKPIETRFSASNRVADISISPLRVALERQRLFQSSFGTSRHHSATVANRSCREWLKLGKAISKSWYDVGLSILEVYTPIATNNQLLALIHSILLLYWMIVISYRACTGCKASYSYGRELHLSWPSRARRLAGTSHVWAIVGKEDDGIQLWQELLVCRR